MKKKKVDISGLNVTKIIDAIVDAPIPDDVKLKALDDIKKMYTDDEYGDAVNISTNFENPIEIPFGAVACHHHWASSNLGHDFWSKLDQILDA